MVSLNKGMVVRFKIKKSRLETGSYDNKTGLWKKTLP